MEEDGHASQPLDSGQLREGHIVVRVSTATRTKALCCQELEAAKQEANDMSRLLITCTRYGIVMHLGHEAAASACEGELLC